jgi:hypothetical protein
MGMHREQIPVARIIKIGEVMGFQFYNRRTNAFAHHFYSPAVPGKITAAVSKYQRHTALFIRLRHLI